MALACLMTYLVVTSVGTSSAHADSPTVDGQFSGTGPIGPGATVNLTVVGRGGVPVSGVGSVVLNVTVTNPSASSFVTVWPAGGGRPNASNLNFVAGQTVPNMVVVPVGVGGQVSIFNYAGSADVVVDVLGWFPAGGSFTGLTPARLMDSRPGSPTVDGGFANTGQVGAGATVGLTVVGRGGVPVSGVGSVVLNVTVTNPSASSFVTVWPAGGGRPNASNLNFVAGQTVPNMVVVPVGVGGQVSIFNYAGSADVVVDVLGWFPAGGSFTGLTPARLMDSRPGSPTVDGGFANTGQVGAGATVGLTVVGRGGVPVSGVGSVVLNVTVTNPSASSFVTVWPAGGGRPNASNLNFVAGQTVPNMVVVPVGVGGQVSIFNYAGSADVVVDVLGWFPAGGSFTGLTPARLMDSRSATIASSPPGPVRNLLVVRPTLHQMTGSDRIAVWVCDVPSDTTNATYRSFDSFATGPKRLTLDPGQVAAWAQSTVGPYYGQISLGRYQPTFSGVGHITLTRSDGPNECQTKAVAQTGRPFTNVVAMDNSTAPQGQGSPGLMGSSDAQNLDLFDVPPSESRRSIWLGGGLINSPEAVAHEIGHTLHWPHSYVGPTEYDDPTDVMSGSTNAAPINTQAFNRFAAGWIDDNQVQLQRSGTNTYTLDAPGGGGVQMVAAPDGGDPHVLLTLEARPAVGPDQHFPVEGVAAYIVDQRPNACDNSDFFGACISTSRRQTKAVGGSNTFDNILQVGSTTRVDGLTIVVTGKSGSTFTVQVSGTFAAPAQLSRSAG